ncbi:MAG: magnesium transporter CorA family protein [Patescibacteria group bacterium]
MIQTLASKHLQWLIANRPTPEELYALKDTVTFPPFLVEEITAPSHRPKVVEYDEFLYLALHFPFYDSDERTVRSREIDFVINKDILLTVQYDPIPPLEKVRSALADEEARAHYFSTSAQALLNHLLSDLFEVTFTELDRIKEEIDTIEERIYQGLGRETIEEISRVKRNLINFRSAMHPQHAMLEYVREYKELSSLIHQYHQLINLLESHTETLNALDQTNQSLISMYTNEITKTLTIMAFTTFPLMLFTSLFGMNTSILPIVGRPNDFWIIVGIMVLATGAMFAFFKNKKWI